MDQAAAASLVPGAQALRPGLRTPYADVERVVIVAQREVDASLLQVLDDGSWQVDTVQARCGSRCGRCRLAQWGEGSDKRPRAQAEGTPIERCLWPATSTAQAMASPRPVGESVAGAGERSRPVSGTKLKSPQIQA